MPAAGVDPKSSSPAEFRADQLQAALDITNNLLSAVSSDDPVSSFGTRCRPRTNKT